MFCLSPDSVGAPTFAPSSRSPLAPQETSKVRPVLMFCLSHDFERPTSWRGAEESLLAEHKLDWASGSGSGSGRMLRLLLLLGCAVALDALVVSTPLVEVARGGFRAPVAASAPKRASSSLLLAAASDTTSTESGDDSILLYNTASREKQALKPLEGKKIRFYSCGPTVYDEAHIGNCRAQLTYDLLKRWLTYTGHQVDHVCNLTDVDDKIIQRMQRDNVSLKDLTNTYADRFFEDLKALNIIPAGAYPRATDHIQDIVTMIEGLLERGLAYEQKGSYYFRVAAHQTYGALSNVKFDGLQDGSGEGGGISDLDEYEGDKESAKDFALWKAYKPEDGQVFWETSLGKGRPGWHIECSAMARKYLGDTIDIHAGGIDLIFPHHENEMAQSEGFSGKPFCNCWVHNGFVNVDSEKMSKSKGNMLTLRKTFKTKLDVRAFRYYVCSSYYRSPLNFTPEALGGAKKSVQRLDKFREALLAVAAEAGSGGIVDDSDRGSIDQTVAKAVAQFESGMRDDLNAPRATAGLFALVKAGEKLLKGGKGALSLSGAETMLDGLNKMDHVLGVFYEPPGFEEEVSSEPTAIALQSLPADVLLLVDRRAQAKADRDYAGADQARDELAALGYSVKDLKGGGIEVMSLS
jgi:cysteinyl-tRNA synthetase